ncbi:MAG TPA: hypothetical protein PKZ52_03500 [Cellvibrionaceae bacterium]|nr:hypothetical protein [Cellvibrionaceae bacterium]
MTPSRCGRDVINRIFTLGLFAWIATGDAYGLSSVRTQPVVLSKSEFSLLEAVACQQHHQVAAVDIKAESNVDNPKSKTAVVTCASKQDFMGQAANNIVYCGAKGARWECQKGPLRVQVPLQGRQVKLYLMRVAPQEAFEGLAKVITLQFQGYFIDKIVGDSCDVSKNKFPAEIEFHCDGGKFVLSKYCLDTNCPRILSVN